MTELKFDISVATIVLIAAVAVGQAQQPRPQPHQHQPQQPQQAQKSSQVATAAVASSTALTAAQKTTATSPSATKSPAAAPAPNSGASDELIKEARNAGFKPVMLRGTQMFCRTAVELGSSFPVRTCYDSDQVKIKIHEYQEERMQLEQMHGNGSQPQ